MTQDEREELALTIESMRIGQVAETGWAQAVRDAYNTAIEAAARVVRGQP
jgi:hypothetical protein